MDEGRRGQPEAASCCSIDVVMRRSSALPAGLIRWTKRGARSASTSCAARRENQGMSRALGRPQKETKVH